MSAKILDGTALATEIRKQLAIEVERLALKDIVPGLAVVLVGNDPASQTYVRLKQQAAEEVGICSFDNRPPADISQEDLLALIARLNDNRAVHGILVQLPLPPHLERSTVLDAILPDKDVDGLHPENVGLLLQNRPRVIPATPRGCMRLIEESGIDLDGKSAVVVGRSNLVGRPMAMLLTNANATVTVCHSHTMGLPDKVAAADVVIAAVGITHLIRGEWIKLDAVVIDVGFNRQGDNTFLGDVEFSVAVERASAITPVPGGVGPMTIASLLQSTIDMALRQQDN